MYATKISADFMLGKFSSFFIAFTLAVLDFLFSV